MKQEDHAMPLWGVSYLQRVPIIHALTPVPTDQHPGLLYSLHTLQVAERPHSRRGQMEENDYLMGSKYECERNLLFQHT